MTENVLVQSTFGKSAQTNKVAAAEMTPPKNKPATGAIARFSKLVSFGLKSTLQNARAGLGSLTTS